MNSHFYKLPDSLNSFWIDCQRNDLDIYLILENFFFIGLVPIENHHTENLRMRYPKIIDFREAIIWASYQQSRYQKFPSPTKIKYISNHFFCRNQRKLCPHDDRGLPNQVMSCSAMAEGGSLQTILNIPLLDLSSRSHLQFATHYECFLREWEELYSIALIITICQDQNIAEKQTKNKKEDVSVKCTKMSSLPSGKESHSLLGVLLTTLQTETSLCSKQNQLNDGPSENEGGGNQGDKP